MNAVDMLISDHRRVEKLFNEYKNPTNTSEKWDAAQQALMELQVHSKLEEEIFYPALRSRASELQDIVAEGYQEHATVDNLIMELKAMQPGDQRFASKFQELMQDVQHHVQEEETEMLPDARQKLGSEADQLGHEMTQRKEQLLQQLMPQMRDAGDMQGSAGTSGSPSMNATSMRDSGSMSGAPSTGGSSTGANSGARGMSGATDAAGQPGMARPGEDAGTTR